MPHKSWKDSAKSNWGREVPASETGLPFTETQLAIGVLQSIAENLERLCEAVKKLDPELIEERKERDMRKAENRKLEESRIEKMEKILIPITDAMKLVASNQERTAIGIVIRGFISACRNREIEEPIDLSIESLMRLRGVGKITADAFVAAHQRLGKPEGG